MFGVDIFSAVMVLLIGTALSTRTDAMQGMRREIRNTKLVVCFALIGFIINYLVVMAFWMHSS
jgi:hypothetical protein